MLASDRQEIYSYYPKKILASCVSNKISSSLKLSFLKNLEPLEKARNDPRDYRLAASLGRGTGKIHDIVDPNMNCLENSWIATEFLIDSGNKVKINGDINNIDPQIYSSLYKDIGLIFESMLPYMQEVRKFDTYLKQSKKLNVIVKVQSYELQNGETYEGQFHQEGFKREGIFMIAIYYCKISKELKNGNLELKFVKEKKYSEDQGCMNYLMETKQFDVREGDIAVFLNRRCEHRITKLETQQGKPGESYERKILAFFIADPMNSNIPTSSHLKLNHQIPLKEKDLVYAKRDDFKKGRFVANGNEVDYSENEGENIAIKEVFIENKEPAKLPKTNQSEITIEVKTLEGKKFNIQCKPDLTIESVKMLIYAKEKTPVDEQRLIFAGKQMEESRTLSFYGINDGSSIHLVKRLRGD